MTTIDNGAVPRTAAIVGSPLEVSHLSVSFPLGRGERVTVIDDVSFTLRAGETFGLVGESGSGKSMTALSILRLHGATGGTIDSGSIRFFGRELTTLSEDQMADVRGREIAMIFQDASSSLDPAFTVGQQIASVMIRHLGVGRREARAETVELLGEVGIPEPRRRIDQYPHQFSGGMCQRVMIAMALACRPKLLLADEPTTALDVTTQAQIVQLMARLSSEFGMTTVFTTHDLGLIHQISDRVAVMYAGQIVEVGSVDEVFAEPCHPYTQALLACVVEPLERGGFAAIRGQQPAPTALPSGCRFHPRCSYSRDACAIEDMDLREVRSGRTTRCGFVEELELRGVFA